MSAYVEKQMPSLDWQTRHHQPSPTSVHILLQHLPGSYNITKTPAISDAEAVEAVSTALCKAPRRDETTKFVILLKKEYDAFVELVKTAHSKKKVTKDRARVEALNKAYGCVSSFLPTSLHYITFDTNKHQILFFTDCSPLPQPILEGSNAQPPKEKPNKKDVENAVNRQVYLVAQSLCKAGCGSNLQQFDGIDKFVHDRWGIPSAWKLHSQMIFGGLEAPVSFLSLIPTRFVY
jgi:predicted oxidoreductase (fatty acid repression mutant protein)